MATIAIPDIKLNDGHSIPQFGFLQRGDIVFPKSVTPARIAENIQVFDFTLDDTDLDRISALDRGEAGRQGAHPDTFDYLPA